MSRFAPSKVPRFAFADTLEGQEDQLRRNPLLRRMREARRRPVESVGVRVYHPILAFLDLGSERLDVKVDG